jgi:hypothetical protein
MHRLKGLFLGFAALTGLTAPAFAQGPAPAPFTVHQLTQEIYPE